MAPAKRTTRRTRQTSGASGPPNDITQSLPSMREIFNNSQHVHSIDLALNQLKKLYKVTPFEVFEPELKNCVKKMFQSKSSLYFQTSCDFLCKFLQYVSKLSDEVKTKDSSMVLTENTAPSGKGRRTSRSSFGSNTSTDTIVSTAGTKRSRNANRGTKRKDDDSDEDELLKGFCNENIEESIPVTKKRKSTTSTTVGQITNHDRIISACMDVADQYMLLQDDECRLNAVFFISKFLNHVDTLDEMICERLKKRLPERMRDKKPMIRTRAALASRTFQDMKFIADGFKLHFERDPDLMVRKALLQIMEPKIFGYDFIIESTQDNSESMRKTAFQRLGKISPMDLESRHLHRVIHNGLNERERQASYSFKSHTLHPWLSTLYDGTDLHQLLKSFDVLSYHEVVCRLLQVIYERDLEDLQNNATTTKLHQVVESFRAKWFNTDNSCLPVMESLDENVTIIWTTLVKFCKINQAAIKTVKISTKDPEANDPNESIEKILDSQERTDEVVELYERLTPDLVNLVDFLKRFIHQAHQDLNSENGDACKLEFIYQQIMELISTYEVGDELERKTVQEVFGNILKENLLTGKFNNFIPPIIRCLYNLIYSSSPNLMINYISELINNVRSHLEDLVTSTQTMQQPISTQLASAASALPPRSAKKVRIDANSPGNRRQSRLIEQDRQNLEFKIATIRVEIEELRDLLDQYVKEKEFDKAKETNNKISDLQSELNVLHGRRSSIASDISHMSMIIETEPTGNDKLSSTMIGDTSMNESSSSATGQSDKDEIKIFKYHTNELLKCLQMYFGCLQSVKTSEVPQTMLNHLTHLSYECLDEWFKEDARVRSLMVACNGLTALVDKNFAKLETTSALLIGACYDKSLELKTVGFKSLVDVMCEHEDLDIPLDRVEKFINSSLRDYDRFSAHELKKAELDFATALVESSAKLLYFKKLSSADTLSHLILWWYHPKTNSRLKQFIGIFLPTFVGDLLNDPWLDELLEETFLCSVEFLHTYILDGKGNQIMVESDMRSLISFLCNLIPVSIHPKIVARVEDRIDDLSSLLSGPHRAEERKEEIQDLLKYLEKSKSSLTAAPSAPKATNGDTGEQPVLCEPIEQEMTD